MNSKLFAERRERLMELMGPGSIGIWISPPSKARNADSHYRYRPSSDIIYLTGCPEPQTAVVIKTDGEENFTLFLRERDPEREVWEGLRVGTERAKELFGADRVEPFQRLEEVLPELMTGCKKIYYQLGENPDADQKVLSAWKKAKFNRRTGKVTPYQIEESQLLLAELRLFKDAEEISLIRRAAEITAFAHKMAMAAAAPGIFEYQLESLIQFIFKNSGAFEPAYTTIVGSGERAAILHYIENSAQIKAGELVLIDAGAELQYYAADITRTFPADGKFTPLQRDLYSVVLTAQKEAIAQCKPGNTFSHVHDTAVKKLTEGLIQLGILEGSVEENIEKETYKEFYMHRTGHWLGLDVHDVGNYYDRDGRERTFRPGMILTVEPGLYFHPEFCKSERAKEFLGIGIRIEDDVLITENGFEILTADAPKEIEEIESIVGSQPELLKKFSL